MRANDQKRQESSSELSVFAFVAVTDIHSIVNIGLATTEGLAVDWIGNHIYWVESNLDQIEVRNVLFVIYFKISVELSLKH